MTHVRFAIVPFLFLVLAFQAPQNLIRQHYEAAEAQRRAGNLPAAEAEYKAILAEGYGKLGSVYAALKDYQTAISALESAALYGSASEELSLSLAIAYFDTEQYQKALELSRAALNRYPQSIGAHHMLGKSYFMLGEFTKAASELETALKLGPNDYDIAYTLALAYLKQHQMAPAKVIFDQMLKQLGDRPQLRVVFGRAYRETDFLAEAIEEFKKAVALEPNFPRAHYYLGLTYLLKDGAAKLSEAAAEFKIELTAHPDEFFANYYLGIVSFMQRDLPFAISLLEKASQLQPNNPDPYFQLGQAYQAGEKYDQAITALRKSIALNPYLSHNDYQVTNAHYHLGQSLIKIGKSEEGQKELQTASDLKLKAKKRDEAKAAFFLGGANLHQQNPEFPELHLVEGVIAESNAPDQKTREELRGQEAYYAKVVASAHNNIGLLRAQQDDFRVAAEQFSLAAKWNPQLEEIDFNQGLALFKAEIYTQAIPPLEKELKSRPGNDSAKHLLALSYFMVEDYTKAVPLLNEVVASKPTDTGAYYALAFSLIKLGKKELADQAISQMIRLAGNTPQVHILLGQAYDQQNDTVKALEELKLAQTLDPKTRLAHYFAGLIYLKMGSFNEAVQEFESELSLSPNDVQTKYHLGFVMLASQKTERGIELMKEVIQLKPDYAEAHYELGKALLPRGDVKGAVEHLEIAAKLQPDRAYVHYQLGRAYLAAGRKADGESQLEVSKQLKDKERNQPN